MANVELSLNGFLEKEQLAPRHGHKNVSKGQVWALIWSDVLQCIEIHED